MPRSRRSGMSLSGNRGSCMESLLWSSCCACEYPLLWPEDARHANNFFSVARYRRFGLRGARADDALMLIAITAFTVLVYGINFILSRGMEAAFIAPDQLARMTQEEIDLVIDNSKWMYAHAHLIPIIMWSAKPCMVILYLRITSVSLSSGVNRDELKRLTSRRSDGPRARRWLICVAVYVALSFVGVELAIWLTCLPITERWMPNMDSMLNMHRAT